MVVISNPVIWDLLFLATFLPSLLHKAKILLIFFYLVGTRKLEVMGPYYLICTWNLQVTWIYHRIAPKYRNLFSQWWHLKGWANVWVIHLSQFAISTWLKGWSCLMHELSIIHCCFKFPIKKQLNVSSEILCVQISTLTGEDTEWFSIRCVTSLQLK